MATAESLDRTSNAHHDQPVRRQVQLRQRRVRLQRLGHRFAALSTKVVAAHVELRQRSASSERISESRASLGLVGSLRRR